MTPMVLLAVMVLIAAAAGVAGYALGRSAAGAQALDAQAVDAVRRQDAELRALVARLKDLAWDHRELDSTLATIIVDEIRTFEKKELGP